MIIMMYSHEDERPSDPIQKKAEFDSKPNAETDDLDKKVHGCAIFRALKQAKKDQVKHVYDYGRRLLVPPNFKADARNSKHS